MGFKSNYIKLMLVHTIGFLPFNFLRVFFYRVLFKYKIHKSHVGRNTIILVKSANISNCSIGSRNKFIGPFKMDLDKNVKIGDDNNFICGWWVEERKFNNSGYSKSLTIMKDVLITSGHYFDLAGQFTLGDSTWVAGFGSQFWTHGAGVKNRDIFIGNNNYIGSRVLFSPGSSIGNNCLVSLGSVVTKSFQEDNVLIGGQPAKVLRRNYNWKERIAK